MKFCNDQIAYFKNSESEIITTDKVTYGDFKGKYILVIHEGLKSAPHLLDKETIAFLLKELPKL